MRLITLLFFFCVFCASGQNDTAYYNFFGGEKDDYFESVIQNDDKSFSILGNTSSYGNGETDILLINLDSNLKLISSFTLGTENIDEVKEFKKVNNKIYFAGKTNAWGNGGYDIYLAKTKINGDIIWEKTIGNESWDDLIDIDIKKNSILLLGEIIEDGMNKTTLMNLDTNGNILQKLVLDSLGTLKYSDILNLGNNSFFLTGFSADSLNINFILQKLNRDNINNFIFDKKYLFNESQKIINGSINNGDIYMVGESNFISKTNNFDYYLTKLDTLGTFNWSSHFGSSTVGNDLGNDVIFFNDTIYTIGSTNSYGAGMNDFYFIYCNKSGNYLNGTTFGFPREDLGKKIIKTKKWTYLFGDSQDFGINYFDILIIKTKGIFASPPKKFQLNNLNSPNVISKLNKLNPRTNKEFDRKEFYNLIGQQIKFSNELKGIYFVKYFQNGELKYIVKEYFPN